MTSLYEHKSRFLLFREKLKAAFIADSLKKLSRRNALNDYAQMLDRDDDRLWKLHRDLEAIREDGTKNYAHYDYGSGYYYQSMKQIGVSGYRNTEERIEQLHLHDLLKDRTVLDIGSNTGFLLLYLSKDVARGVGIEFNPYLVRTADAVKEFLGAGNIEFLATSFEDYEKPDGSFDAVLSLANHSTYDGNTRQNVEEYFDRCSRLLSSGGLLVFESHPPKIEPADKLNETIRIISERFTIVDRPAVRMGGFLDKDRTYVVAQKA